MKRVLSRIGLLGVGLVLALCYTAAASSPVTVCTSTDGSECFAYAAHPHTMHFGADGRLAYVKLSWSHWGRGVASANGIRRDDAGPAGHPEYIRHKIHMSASHVATCGQHRAYTRLVITGHGVPNEVLRGCFLR